MKRLLILVLFACPLTTHAGTCKPPDPCQPGDTVSVTAASLSKVTFSKVTLMPAKVTGEKIDGLLRTDVPPDPTGLSFVIPQDAQDGTYLIQISAKPKPTVPEQTNAAPPTATPIDDLSPNEIVIQSPFISAVSPAAAFLEDHGVNTVTILGSGFRKNVSAFEFQGLATPPRCAENAGNDQKKNCYELKMDDERRMTLAFYALDPNKDYYKGPHDFHIRVDGLNTKPAKLALIDTSEGVPMAAALTGLALIVLMVYGLIRAGKKIITQTLGGKDYLLSALFLDVQTSSYSLSKCQFYAWTATAVLGYLFLAISRSFVQGIATFPDIPSGLPGILLASAGTTVVAAGITSAKGGKGAGGPQPNLSDFICTGGVVAADRLQFAVWTVVGIGTFLSIVLRSDPRNINDLPAIPSGFLQLMGISAGGYLAGKLARKSGPTLDAMAISGTPAKLTFQLTGSGLSRSALFSIDDVPIYPDTLQGKDPSSKLPDVVQLDPTAGDPDFARILSFTVVQPQTSWLGGTEKHNFAITNPDKQKATLPFQIFKVTGITITAANQTLTITGQFLDDKLQVTYMTPGGQPIAVTGPKMIAGNYNATVQASLSGTVTVKVADTAGVTVTQDVTIA